MINSLIKIFTGKELVLYDKHRQTLPLVSDPKNRKAFFFLQVAHIWGLIPFKSSDKRKHKIMFVILSVLKPRYILGINWLSPRETLYKVWTKSHPRTKFVVVQHGAYVGGIVTEINHRYAKCDIFLTWGDYFTLIFREYNKGKRVEIISFGNPVYNLYSRENIKPKINHSSTVLLIPSLVTNEMLPYYNKLIEKLKALGYFVYFKPHSFQKRSKYAMLTNVIEKKEVLRILLTENNFDFIISDISSALLDAIFFKNKVAFFDPSNAQKNGYVKNIYSTYLTNIYPACFHFENKEDFDCCFDLNAQENILSLMYKANNNSLSSLG